LQSIITFNEDENNESGKNTHESTDNVNLMKKRKRSNSIEGIKERKSKKMNSATIKTVNNRQKKKKDKHKKSDMYSGQKNFWIELSDSENNPRVTLNESLDFSIEKSEEIMPSEDDKKETNIESNNDDSIVKKKRKRNKGKKGKSDVTINTPGLRIMSK